MATLLLCLLALPSIAFAVPPGMTYNVGGPGDTGQQGGVVNDGWGGATGLAMQTSVRSSTPMVGGFANLGGMTATNDMAPQPASDWPIPTGGGGSMLANSFSSSNLAGGREEASGQPSPASNMAGKSLMDMAGGAGGGGVGGGQSSAGSGSPPPGSSFSMPGGSHLDSPAGGGFGGGPSSPFDMPGGGVGGGPSPSSVPGDSSFNAPGGAGGGPSSSSNMAGGFSMPGGGEGGQQSFSSNMAGKSLMDMSGAGSSYEAPPPPRRPPPQDSSSSFHYGPPPKPSGTANTGSGASSMGGPSQVGGPSQLGGASQMGGALHVGGGSPMGGVPPQTGGASQMGGSLPQTGGASQMGGAPPPTGGALFQTGGATQMGGAPPPRGGASQMGGASQTSGASQTGGAHQMGGGPPPMDPMMMDSPMGMGMGMGGGYYHSNPDHLGPLGLKLSPPVPVREPEPKPSAQSEVVLSNMAGKSLMDMAGGSDGWESETPAHRPRPRPQPQPQPQPHPQPQPNPQQQSQHTSASPGAQPTQPQPKPNSYQAPPIAVGLTSSDQSRMSNRFVTGVDKAGDVKQFIPEPDVTGRGMGPIHGLYGGSKTTTPLPEIRKPCDLRVDAVFALDDVKNLWLARDSIRFYDTQLLPSRQTRFGVVLCGLKKSFYTTLHGHVDALLASLEDLEHANVTLDPTTHMADTPGYRTSNNPYPPRVSADFASTDAGCLETVYNLFTYHHQADEKTDRVLTIMGTKDRWGSRVVVDEARFLHSINISVLSLADGDLPKYAQECLRNMASTPDHFRSIRDNVTLHALPTMIGNAVCRPQKADVTHLVQRTSLGKIQQPVVVDCRLLNSTSLERTQSFGSLFGQHTDEIRCVAGLVPDPRLCECV